MCPSLAPEQWDGYYLYFIFNTLSITGQCPMNMNFLAPKVRALQMNSKTKNGDFLENGSKRF
jgi:hypothetical protein